MKSEEAIDRQAKLPIFRKPEQAASWLERRIYERRTMYVGPCRQECWFSMPIDITYTQAVELAKRVRAGTIKVTVQPDTANDLLHVHVDFINDVQNTLR